MSSTRPRPSLNLANLLKSWGQTGLIQGRHRQAGATGTTRDDEMGVATGARAWVGRSLGISSDARAGLHVYRVSEGSSSQERHPWWQCQTRATADVPGNSNIHVWSSMAEVSRGLRCPVRGGESVLGLALDRRRPELRAAQILGCVGATLAQTVL